MKIDTYFKFETRVHTLKNLISSFVCHIHLYEIIMYNFHCMEISNYENNIELNIPRNRFYMLFYELERIIKMIKYKFSFERIVDVFIAFLH